VQKGVIRRASPTPQPKKGRDAQPYSQWLDTKSLQQKTCLLTNDHAKRRRRNDRRSTQRLGTTGDPRIDTSCLDGRRRNRRETPWRIKALRRGRWSPPTVNIRLYASQLYGTLPY